MELLSRADLKQLANPDHDGDHVSLFMATHRFGGGVRADRVQWKNTLMSVESLLADRSVRRPDVDDLLSPAWDLEADPLAWQHMSDGLAMFLRPGYAQTFRVPVQVPTIGAVGERMIVGPLLRVLSGDEHFLLLAMSQGNVRLLEGSRHRVEEVVLADVPGSLRDVVAPAEPRSDTMARPLSAGRPGRAVFFGHGAADDEFKRDEVVRFLRQVADGLDSYLADEEVPMVIVGLEPTVSIYRDISRYAHVIDEGVSTNPDQLSAEQLHAAAWPVVERRLRDDRQQMVEQFERQHGTGRASTDPAEIENAAANGRVETLFLPIDPSCWDVAASEAPAVFELHTADAFAHCELLDRAAVNTLSHGGRVYSVPESMLSGVRVAANFRY